MIPDEPGFFIRLPPGISIHIAPESLFTSPRNDYSHAPESALKFLRSGNRGGFTISEEPRLLATDRSDKLSAIFDEFAQYVDARVIERTEAALEWMEKSTDAEAKRLAEQVRSRLRSGFVSVESIHSLAEQSEILQSSLGSLRGRIQESSQKIANALVAPNRDARLRDLEILLGNASDDDEEDDDEEDDFDDEQGSERARVVRRLLKMTRSLARERVLDTRSSKRGVTSRLAPWIGDRVIEDDELEMLGEKVLLESRVKRLHGAARSFISRVPSFYRQFRRQQASVSNFYLPEAAQGRMRLTPPEADMIILTMLRNAQRTGRLLPNAYWLDDINSNLLMQVYVDEATDFSATELACMLLRTHPRVRSWFACGDFRQRLTGTGIRALIELDWVRAIAGVPHLEIREIAGNYRQSKRLSTFAQAIERGKIEEAPQSLDDPAPLLVENLAGRELGSWITDRIREIEEHVGRLPSIAIFVESEQRIVDLVENAGHFLSTHNIKIVGCREGRDVGQQQEIRVFDIKHIKGLEFEAVFFVGVDVLAQRIPELFKQYIYVGVTRAASFLALCCDGRFPESIEVVRPLTSGGNWSRAAREDK